MSSYVKSDHNRRFKKMIDNPTSLLSENPLLLQKHLDVKQIMHLVEHGHGDVLHHILQHHEISVVDGNQLQMLVEMVVVGSVFRFQNAQLLAQLLPLVQKEEFTHHVKEMVGSLNHEFLEVIEPYIVLPTSRCDVDEQLLCLRNKNMLNEHIGQIVTKSTVKKL